MCRRFTFALVKMESAPKPNLLYNSFFLFINFVVTVSHLHVIYFDSVLPLPPPLTSYPPPPAPASLSMTYPYSKVRTFGCVAMSRVTFVTTGLELSTGACCGHQWGVGPPWGFFPSLPDCGGASSYTDPVQPSTATENAWLQWPCFAQKVILEFFSLSSATAFPGP